MALPTGNSEPHQPMIRTAVILPAGGTSSRFGSNKLLTDLRGQSIFARTLAAFSSRPDTAVILVPTATPELRSLKGITCCAPGSTRAQSVLNALRQVPPELEWVAIHDAARPLVSQQLIDRTLEAARQHGAAAPALPVSLTIKQAARALPSRVDRTVPRASLYSLQTPQVMRRSDLLTAFERCSLPMEQVTDDLQLLELAGIDTWLIPGEPRNIKITTPLDLRIAEALLDEAPDAS